MKYLKLFEEFVNEGQFVLRELEQEFNIDLDLYDNGKFLEL